MKKKVGLDRMTIEMKYAAKTENGKISIRAYLGVDTCKIILHNEKTLTANSKAFTLLLTFLCLSKKKIPNTAKQNRRTCPVFGIIRKAVCNMLIFV